MRPQFTLSAIALTLCCGAQAASFSGTYFFGDGLTDSGAFAGLVPAGGKFTTNPGLVWAEVIAAAYGQTASANNPNNPNLLNPGTNYAQGGAQINSGPGYGGSIATTAQSIHQQVSNFLAAHPAADKNALFGLWGGTNDIFFQLQFAGTLSQAATFAAGNNFAAAQAAANVALTQANSTTDPTRQVTMQALANAALTAAQANSAAGVATVAQQSAGAAQQLVGLAAAETVAEIKRLKEAGVKYIIVPNLTDMGTTPAGVASGASGQASLSALSGRYNTLLADGLRKENLEVIAININGLMKEIIANPIQYGISNTSTPACNTSSSLICTPADLAAVDAASTYFFADGVHPSTATHAIIAQYAIATIEAPTQMAQLVNIGMQNARSQLTVLDDRLQALRLGNNQKNDEVDLFVNLGSTSAEQSENNGAPGTSGSAKEITVGGDRRLGENGHLGLAIAISSSQHDFDSNKGGFDLNAATFTVYGGVITNGFYSQIYAQLGMDHYNNIQRNIQLGNATRIETAEARGTRLGLGVQGGYRWTFDKIHTGPIVGLHYKKIAVESFHEREGDSLSMSYDKQHLNSVLGNLGWAIDMNIQQDSTIWKPFAQLVLNHEFKTEIREVSAGLSSATTHFSMPVMGADKHYLNYKLGVLANFKTWNGSLSYAGASGMNEGSFNTINLMLSRRF
jgi:outer membrane lipase/esterase